MPGDRIFRVKRNPTQFLHAASRLAMIIATPATRFFSLGPFAPWHLCPFFTFSSHRPNTWLPRGLHSFAITCLTLCHLGY